MFKFITLSTLVALAAFAMPGQATSSTKTSKATAACCKSAACACKGACCKNGVCTSNAACCKAKMKNGKKTTGVKSGGSCCPKPAAKTLKRAGA